MTAPLVAVSQRVDVWSGRGERRDALDQRVYLWLAATGCVPVAVPNSWADDAPAGAGGKARDLEDWLDAVQPRAVVLSGGNDIGEMPERDRTEARLLAYARERTLPLLGICRGMQMLGSWAGARLMQVTGHVARRHRLQSGTDAGDWPAEVNSFHDFALAECPSEFVITARSEDGLIEAMRHVSLPWEGWMWHPEREADRGFSAVDIARVRRLFDV